MRLAGRVAVVTGAGSGIGRAIAVRFAQEGAAVAVLDQDGISGAETAAAIVRGGGEALVLVADVADASQVDAACKSVSRRWGRIDILVNSAGIFLANRGDTLVTELEESIWDRVLAVNLKGVYLCCKYGIPLMGQSGSIVNIASIAALIGRDTAQAYVAAKGGVVALTRTLAVQYAPRGIRANAILPGRVDTPLVQADYASAAEREAFARSHPLGRFGQPEDIAALALYLASEESSWVTGAEYVIDGGYTAL